LSLVPFGSAAPGACYDSLIIVSTVCFFFYRYFVCFLLFIVSQFYLFVCKDNHSFAIIQSFFEKLTIGLNHHAFQMAKAQKRGLVKEKAKKRRDGSAGPLSPTCA